jgi:hypothetical protein
MSIPFNFEQYFASLTPAFTDQDMSFLLSPQDQETAVNSGICPLCGAPLTFDNVNHFAIACSECFFLLKALGKGGEA